VVWTTNGVTWRGVLPRRFSQALYSFVFGQLTSEKCAWIGKAIPDSRFMTHNFRVSSAWGSAPWLADGLSRTWRQLRSCSLGRNRRAFANSTVLHSIRTGETFRRWGIEVYEFTGNGRHPFIWSFSRARCFAPSRSSIIPERPENLPSLGHCIRAEVRHASTRLAAYNGRAIVLP